MLPSLARLALATDGKRKRTQSPQPENRIQQGLRVAHASFRLTMAVKHGDLGDVKYLLRHGGSANAIEDDHTRNTVLIEASGAGNVAIVAALLEAGADVDQANRYGHTALMEASRFGHTAVVEMLLGEGADANKVNRYDHTALIEASWGGYAAVVKALLDADPPADVNHANDTGETVLMVASWRGRTAVVEALLAAPGINVNWKNDWGRTALMLASWKGRDAIVEALLAVPGIDVNYVDGNGETALMLAERYDHADVVALLERHIRMRHLFKRWRLWFRVLGPTRDSWRRAIERLYAPGGAGYLALMREFEELQRQGAPTGLTLAQFVAMRVKGARVRPVCAT